MPHGIVDILEVVQVEEHHSELLVDDGRSGEEAFDLLGEVGTVG